MSFRTRLFMLVLGSLMVPTLLLADTSPDAQFYLDKGNLYVQEGKPGTAMQYYKEAVERDPYNVQARNNLGELYARNNDIDQAMEQFNKAIELQPNYVPALTNMAYLFLQKHIYDKTIYYAKRALSIDPESGSAHFNLGTAYLGMKRYDDAVDELKLAVRSYKDTAPVYEKLGDAFQAQNRHEEAVAYYREALNVDPLDASARGKMGESYLALGEEKKAVEQFKYSSDIAPNNIVAQYRLAQHYEDIRDWDHAKRLYLIILSVDDQQAEAHRQLALIYERDEEYGLALYHWNKYAEINPKDQEAAEHIQKIRKPLLSKKQIDQLQAEKKLKDAEAAMQTATPSAPLPMPQDNGGAPPNPWDSNPSAGVQVPKVEPTVSLVTTEPTVVSSASTSPAVVAPADTGASQSAVVAPADQSSSGSASSSSGLQPVGDAPTATPVQSGDIPKLPQ